jgi:hypothetical protein
METSASGGMGFWGFATLKRAVGEVALVALCIETCEIHQRFALSFSIRSHTLDRDLRLCVALARAMLRATNRLIVHLLSPETREKNQLLAAIKPRLGA